MIPKKRNKEAVKYRCEHCGKDLREVGAWGEFDGTASVEWNGEGFEWNDLEVDCVKKIHCGNCDKVTKNKNIQ